MRAVRESLASPLPAVFCFKHFFFKIEKMFFLLSSMFSADGMQAEAGEVKKKAFTSVGC